MSQQERGRRVLVAATTAAVILLSMAAIFHSDVAEGAHTYKILWTENWVSPNRTVSVNDTIQFVVGDLVYDVIQVNETEYSKCQYTDSDKTRATNSVVFKQKGFHYFICGYPATACKSGMKLAVNVM